MALLANLQIGDNVTKRYAKTYLLTEVHSHVNRSHNRFLPDSHPRCEHLDIEVVVPGKQDLTLIEWYTKQISLSGRIVVELTDPGQGGSVQTREIYFNDARCFSLQEEYHIDQSRRRVLTLAFEASELTIDDVTFNSERTHGIH